jgi:hypothetical protein
MTGRLHFGTGEWACTARVDFAPFDVQWLRRLPRALPFAAVTLELSGPDGQVHRLPCRGEAEVLHRESSTFAERVRRSRELARRKLAAWTADFGGARDENLCAPMDLDALASHLGAVRTIVYRLQVTAAEPGAPLVAGEWLVLTKRLEFTAGSNPWRQLSEGTLTREAEPTRPLGRLVLDLGFFAEQMVALAAIETQQDAPNAIADLAEAGLWLLRIVLGIHFLNFLPPGDALGANSADALPGALGNAQPDTCEIVVVPGDATERGRATLRLSRYVPAARRTARPVLLIHGYGAGGSTFTHPAIGTPLAQTLLASGREVWVLDLRTAIGLEQRRYWSFDEVALGDIPRALEHVAAAQPQPVRIDIVAHCIGAAMFSVAALEDERFARQWVGGVVLSQVGPLLRMSAFNRLRGFVASYLQQYLSAEQLTVKPQIDSLPVRMLLDGVLATFPYPDGDGEAARLATVPGFAAVRHRADAIFGQLMHLPNIGDALLPHLDAIYGWVMTRTLAQTIHYARERLLTDASGLNQVVAFERIAANFGFPVLMLHGRLNAVFDWRGSEDTVKLLSAIFDGAPRGGPAANTGPRRLKVIEGYGHQDCLVGEHAHRDVFPHITAFLDEFADAAPTAAKGSKPVVAALPWMGPTLGHVQATGPQLHCRLAVRPPPARADAFAVVYVPARRIAAAHGVDEEGGIWEPLFDEAVADPTTRIDLIERALGVTLHTERVPQYDGFVVLTVHNDLPVPEGRIANGLRVVDTLFASPTLAPTDEATEAARAAWQRASAAERDAAVVELHASWVTAASPTPQPRLTLALMSCQYPAGIVDSTPAMASQARLAGRIATAPTADKPQRLLLLGDQVYVDDLAGLFNPSGSDDIERAYRANLTLPSWRRVGKAVPVLPLIDDHEIANNWEPGVADLTAPLAAWQRFQHKLLADAGAPPFDRELHVAGVPLFVLDVRTARQARTLRPTEDAALLDEALIHPGGATWQRLRAWLQEVPAERPKLIATSVSIFPFARAALAEGAGRIALDDWGGYPRSLQALLALIAELQVKHVVLLSGDRHLSSVSSLWLETSAAPLEVVSIVASAAYAPWPFANQPPEELWLNGPATFASSARGGHTLRGEMVTAACDTHHGFALVQLREQPGGGGGTSWRLSVELDLADGHILCERNLAEPSRRWQVREQR